MPHRRDRGSAVSETLQMRDTDLFIHPGDPVLITRSTAVIGSRVVETLLRSGFSNLRCFVRPSSMLARLEALRAAFPEARIELVQGNLLSRDDCAKAAGNAVVIFHLAAGIDKTFPGSFMNSVVTTRNLLDAAVACGTLRRFVNISSFALYSDWHIRRGSLLD